MKTKTEKVIIDLIEDGQHWDLVQDKYIYNYKPFVMCYAGTIRDALKTNNPVHVSCIIHEIEKILGIINPELTKEVDWFCRVSKALKSWVNDRIKTHRLLGIKNDNQ